MNVAALFKGQPWDCRRDSVALVVEDEALIRMALVETLMDDGYEVIEATSADEALFVLRQRPDVNLIVSDVETLGSTNSFMLARRMTKQRPDVCMIVVSGRSAPKPGELPAGVSFIAKPYCAETLLFVANRMAQRLSAAA